MASCAVKEEADAMKVILKKLKSMPVLMLNAIEQNIHSNKQYIKEMVVYNELAVEFSTAMVYNKKYPHQAPKDLKRKRPSDSRDSQDSL